MNSIVFTHFAAPIPGTSRLDAALDRLGAYLDAEIGSLEDLFDIVDDEDATDDIGVLRMLHLDAASTPVDTRKMLEDARAFLERLLERVRALPYEGAPAGPAPSDLDAWLHWSGARLEDIVATLDYLLAA